MADSWSVTELTSDRGSVAHNGANSSVTLGDLGSDSNSYLWRGISFILLPFKKLPSLGNLQATFN